MKKIAFRFAFTYISLFILLLLFSLPLETILRWFAQNIMGWGEDFSIHSTGSGDRTFDYVRLAFNIFLTIPIVIVWSVFERQKKSYKKLFYWYQVTIRVVLIFAMFLYGFAKIFKAQFADHGLERLLQTVGDMSPMGLAWTFMGHSFYYNIFIGFTEILGGLLLIFRRTTTLGSLIIIGVMTNVFMMNFMYDVPVKLVSFHIILMALIVLSVNGKRVFNFFFKNVDIESEVYYDSIKNPTFKKVISIGKKLVATTVIGILIIQSFVQFNALEQLKEKSEFYGIWETQKFVKNKVMLPPLLTDDYRWRYLIIDKKKKVVVKKMTDSLDRFQFEINVDLKEIIFRRSKGDSISKQFSYKFTNADFLEIKGNIDGDSLTIQFRRKPMTDFRLINRKFHWVNETPYNH